MGLSPMTWRDLEAAAPELAELGRACLERVGVAMLGTLRADGSPRLATVEPHIVGEQLVVGVMPWSAKARDLARDPRCALHSIVSGPDTGESELEVRGLAIEIFHPDDVRAAAPSAWWAERSPDEALLFAVDVVEAAVVLWDTDRGLMTVRQWSSQTGLRLRERAYP